KERMCELDQTNCGYYTSRLEDFLKKWDQKLKEWDEGFSKLKGLKVIEYHRLYDYLLRRYDLMIVGTLEPLPGIPPTAKHIEELIRTSQGVKFVLQDVYHERRTANYVASRLGAKMVVLPHDVESLPKVKNLFDMFDEILRGLSQ
ncbi:MAG: metal ABC transporter substrate-binding protein, partial [Aquificaceae bacterium]